LPVKLSKLSRTSDKASSASGGALAQGVRILATNFGALAIASTQATLKQSSIRHNIIDTTATKQVHFATTKRNSNGHITHSLSSFNLPSSPTYELRQRRRKPYTAHSDYRYKPYPTLLTSVYSEQRTTPFTCEYNTYNEYTHNINRNEYTTKKCLNNVSMAYSRIHGGHSAWQNALKHVGHIKVFYA
jgi:hypothetical protein